MHLYSHIRSPWCRKVEWALLEMGLAHQVPTTVAGANGEDQKVGVTLMKEACGSHSTLPSLKMGDFVLSESTAVLFFLADELKYDGAFFPKNHRSRALIQQWDRITDINMGANILSPWLRNTVFLNGKTADASVFDKCRENFVKLEERLVDQLAQNTHLVGSDFTYADVGMAHLLIQIKSLDGPTLQNTKAQNWLQKCAERPHYQTLSART
jgi:glutathione S-transferase